MKVRGLAPKLPLTMSDTDGYTLIKEYREMIHQNIKMLLLTVPGERLMEPRFGVGLKRYMFEQNTSFTHDAIESKINEQLEKYMPHTELEEINFITSDMFPQLNENYLKISMSYYIKPLGALEVIDFNFDLNKQLLINEG